MPVQRWRSTGLRRGDYIIDVGSTLTLDGCGRSRLRHRCCSAFNVRRGQFDDVIVPARPCRAGAIGSSMGIERWRWRRLRHRSWRDVVNVGGDYVIDACATLALQAVRGTQLSHRCMCDIRARKAVRRTRLCHRCCPASNVRRGQAKEDYVIDRGSTLGFEDAKRKQPRLRSGEITVIDAGGASVGILVGSGSEPITSSN